MPDEVRPPVFDVVAPRPEELPRLPPLDDELPPLDDEPPLLDDEPPLLEDDPPPPPLPPPPPPPLRLKSCLADSSIDSKDAGSASACMVVMNASRNRSVCGNLMLTLWYAVV